MVTLDVPHVFRVFRGPAGLLALLERYQPQHKPRYNAVQMWRQRGRIPSNWLVTFFYCVEREGYSCLEFLIDNDEFAVDTGA